MADVELVIKIPEEMYKQIIDENGIDTRLIPYKDIIKNGTPLPKGHGDLVDRDRIISDGVNKGFCDWYDEIKYADTIIETESEG